MRCSKTLALVSLAFMAGAGHCAADGEPVREPAVQEGVPGGTAPLPEQPPEAPAAVSDEVPPPQTLPVKPVPAGLARVNGCRNLKLARYALPRYPAAMRWTGQEGWVVVRFNVSRSGKPQDPQVFDASPARFFDADALAAMKAFRYAASAKGRKDCLQLFQFRPEPENE